MTATLCKTSEQNLSAYFIKTVGTLITGKCASVHPHSSFFICTEGVKLSDIRALVGPYIILNKYYEKSISNQRLEAEE